MTFETMIRDVIRTFKATNTPVVNGVFVFEKVESRKYQP